MHHGLLSLTLDVIEYCATAGGMLWFPDLGQVGLHLAAVHAPLGMLGAALPAAVAFAMFANINRSFGTPAYSQKGDKCLT